MVHRWISGREKERLQCIKTACNWQVIWRSERLRKVHYRLRKLYNLEKEC